MAARKKNDWSKALKRATSVRDVVQFLLYKKVPRADVAAKVEELADGVGALDVAHRAQLVEGALESFGAALDAGPIPAPDFLGKLASGRKSKRPAAKRTAKKRAAKPVTKSSKRGAKAPERAAAHTARTKKAAAPKRAAASAAKKRAAKNTEKVTEKVARSGGSKTEQIRAQREASASKREGKKRR